MKIKNLQHPTFIALLKRPSNLRTIDFRVILFAEEMSLKNKLEDLQCIEKVLLNHLPDLCNRTAQCMKVSLILDRPITRSKSISSHFKTLTSIVTKMTLKIK